MKTSTDAIPPSPLNRARSVLLMMISLTPSDNRQQPWIHASATSQISSKYTTQIRRNPNLNQWQLRTSFSNCKRFMMKKVMMRHSWARMKILMMKLTSRDIACMRWKKSRGTI
jgi:hypothetical protein